MDGKPREISKHCSLWNGMMVHYIHVRVWWISLYERDQNTVGTLTMKCIKLRKGK